MANTKLPDLIEQTVVADDDLVYVVDISDTTDSADGSSRAVQVSNLRGSVTDLTVSGTLDITHTAAEADDHALEIDVNIAGFADVKAIDVVYVTGAIASGSVEGVVLVNIDEFAALGGDIHGLSVLATEGSADKITGLFAGTSHVCLEILWTRARSGQQPRGW